MGVRLYDPNTGRFLSTDPIYSGHANPYVYPDDPIAVSDRSGRDDEGSGGGGAGGGGVRIGPGDSDPEQGGDGGEGDGDSVVSLDPGRQVKAIDVNLVDQTYEHVFQAKHDFGKVLSKLGRECAVLTKIVRSLFSGDIEINSQGVFDVTRKIDGVTVRIRGKIINGIPQISTAFVPKKRSDERVAQRKNSSRTAETRCFTRR